MNCERTMQLSVLVVDNDPAVIVFTAILIETAGMRALMARTSGEAVEIAHKTHVPLDVVLANDDLIGEDEKQILDRIRPGVRHLSMASEAADGVIRVQPLIRMSEGQPRLCQLGLIESIRQAATPLLRTFGASAAKRPKLNRRVVWESAVGIRNCR